LEEFREICIYLKDKCNGFWVWLNQNKLKNILIAISAFLCTIVGFFLFVEFILPPLLVICGIAFFFWVDRDDDLPVPKGQKPSELDLDLISGTLMPWVYTVITDLYDVSAFPPAIRKSTGIGEVYATPSIIVFKGLDAFRFKICLRSNNQDMDIDLFDIKEILQGEFLNALEEFKLPNQPYKVNSNGKHIPYLSFNGEPLIVIADVTRQNLTLTVTAFWINSPSMSKKVKDWRMNSTNGHVKGGDIDETDSTDSDF